MPLRQKSTLRAKGQATPGVSLGANTNLNTNANTGGEFKQSQNPEIRKSESTKKKKAPEEINIKMDRGYSKTTMDEISKNYNGKEHMSIVGKTPKEIYLFNKDSYLTASWTPLMFAIHNSNIDAVRYFLEDQKQNVRIESKNRNASRDETEFDAEVFPLILAINNQNEDMLDYLWGMNELWDSEHLKIVLQIIFSRTVWLNVVEILLGSEATQDIYNGLSHADRKQFLIELFYRYLQQSNDQIKFKTRELCVMRPYALISMHFLIAEKNPENRSLISQS